MSKSSTFFALAVISLLLAGCNKQTSSGGAPTAPTAAATAPSSSPAANPAVSKDDASTQPAADAGVNGKESSGRTRQPAAQADTAPAPVAAQAKDSGSAWKSGMPMPIYVTPFYDSKGPQIDAGPFSKKLAEANAQTIAAVGAEMKKQRDGLSIEAMYVAAIRHYDLGQKDEAVYWFYSAQFRARLFGSILADNNSQAVGGSAFEATSAHNSFYQLAGEYINGYAFGDLEKLKATLQTVRSEGEETMPRFAEIYPKVSFTPENSWPDKRKEIAAGLSQLADMLTQRADEIKATRLKNGVEGKY
jgi:hypothetical protein